jgi:hypothetical protein
MTKVHRRYFDMIILPKKMSEEKTLQAHLSRARRANVRADLTIQQWIETLAHFNFGCAYCNRRGYEALDHYIPIKKGGGTTVSNCVPSCNRCNVRKDSNGKQYLSQYNNQKVIDYLSSRGAVIDIHFHKCEYRKSDRYRIDVYCVECGPVSHSYVLEHFAPNIVKSVEGSLCVVTATYRY